jgi:hypothetical protein
MKLLICTFVLIFNSVSSFAVNDSSHSGNEGGHGGGPEAIEFVSLAKQIYLELQSPIYTDLNRASGLNLEAFKIKIDTALVRSKPSAEMILVQNGNADEVDAIVQPSLNRISIHADRWLSATSSQKLALVLHEYFGLLGIEVDVYNVSINYAPALNAVLLRLISEQRVSPIRYYGEGVISLPLYSRNQCDADNVQSERAIAAAAAQALLKCQVETKANCTVEQSNIRLFSPSSAPEFTYCRARAIARKI